MVKPLVFVWCELVCRTCSAASPGQFTSGAVPRTALKKAALSNGWKLVGHEAFCSAECLREFEAEAKKEAP